MHCWIKDVVDHLGQGDLRFLRVHLQPKTQKQLERECNIGLKSLFEVCHQEPIVDVGEHGNVLGPEESCHWHHALGENPQSGGDPKRKCAKIEVSTISYHKNTLW